VSLVPPTYHSPGMRALHMPGMPDALPGEVVMIRLSEKQGALVRSMGSASTIAKVAQCKALSEADVTRQICDFLRARGWILKRQQSGLFQRPESAARVRIGEVGEADWMALKSTPILSEYGKFAGLSAVIFFGVKAPGRKPSFDQSVWLETRRRLHFEADWFDSPDKFAAWYQERFA